MTVTETFISILLVVVSFFISPSPATNQISLEIETPEIEHTQEIVIYNYSTITYSSPFALNYSEVLFGNTYTTIETPAKTADVIQKEIILKKVTEETRTDTFSFDWTITIEKQCSLPNGAKIEIIADKTYTMQKEGSKLKILQTNCESCDVTVKLAEYPQSLENAKRLYDEKRISYTLHTNKIKLLLKYSKTISCVRSLI